MLRRILLKRRCESSADLLPDTSNYPFYVISRDGVEVRRGLDVRTLGVLYAPACERIRNGKSHATKAASRNARQIYEADVNTGACNDTKTHLKRLAAGDWPAIVVSPKLFEMRF